MRIVIIGGGASGIMAALAAVENGHEVIILERNDRIGKKLLATGNGRCNFTNESLNFENYYSEDSEFFKYALSSFDNEKAKDFFKSIGIEYTVEDRGKVYPLTLQASSFLNSLRMELDFKGVKIIENSFVQKVVKKNEGFILKIKDREDFFAHKVIVATGGRSMPKSGSDGKGYQILESFGHKMNKTMPGLVQINLDSSYLKHLSGVKIVGDLKLYVKNELIGSTRGDILFTDYGISGPTVFDITRKVQMSLEKTKEVYVEIPLVNNREITEDFKDELVYRFNSLSHMSFEQALVGVVNKKIIFLISKDLDIPFKTPMSDLKLKDLENIANLISGYRAKVTGTQGYGNSQVTIGGISTIDFNDKTMESKLVKGLYAVGEVLDVDGDCGGYNLQWAWSSGYLAGKNC